MKVEPEKIGDVLCELEKVLDKMIDAHGLQHGDILSLIDSHLTSHRRDCKENCVDGTVFVYYYGSPEGLK